MKFIINGSGRNSLTRSQKIHQWHCEIMLLDSVMNRVGKVCIFINNFHNIPLNITLQYSRLFAYHVQ